MNKPVKNLTSHPKTDYEPEPWTDADVAECFPEPFEEEDSDASS